MQGTRPCPWSGTPHVEKQLSQWATTAKPMLWSPCSGAHALEPISCNYWSPHALEPMLCNKGMCVLSRVRFFVTPWAVAHQSPLPMESSRQEYQGGLPFPTPGDLPDPGIEPASLISPALASRLFSTITYTTHTHTHTHTHTAIPKSFTFESHSLVVFCPLREKWSKRKMIFNNFCKYSCLWGEFCKEISTIPTSSIVYHTINPRK